MATTRFLLPFTENIDVLALNYALKLAEQRQAILIPLALIQVNPPKAARLEHIQQAQDFLEFVRCKAQRQGVPIESTRMYTSNVARSIEAIAGEMNCESVLLFLSASGTAFLAPAELSALMDHAACNTHVVLLPATRGKKYPLHVPFLKKSKSQAVPLEENTCAGRTLEPQTLIQHVWANKGLN